MDAPSPDPNLPARTPAVRMFGRLQLLRLLGKSERTMAWRVADSHSGQELILVLPRVQPAGAIALQRWMDSVRRASRLNHPQLAPVVDVGVQDGWPYAAYESSGASTLAERLGSKGLPCTEAAAWATQALRGLAFAHEAGVAHQDLQAFSVLLGDDGTLRLAGLEVAGADTAHAGKSPVSALAQPVGLKAHRDAAERDVLAAGLLLHGMLAGAGALEEADIGRVIARLPPCGREIVRLPWTTPQPIPDPLRVIVNRATDRQERQRYRSARTLLRALEGWLQTESGVGGGPLVLLADRLRTAGVLPSQPGMSARAARLAMMERERTGELAEVVLEDLALTFELLRLVNSARVRSAQAAGSGPVLTMRRAIAMLGLDGVRRAALAIRPWPGPLGDAGAAELERLIARCKLAGRVAVQLRPAGYDEEVVVLLATMQNLGRLVVQYHFADEALQIRRLMQAAPSASAGAPEEPGMSEESASFAVLGAGVEAIGIAVARSWGLHDNLLGMMRRVPVLTPVRTPEDDDEMLRAVGSCANEAVDALGLPAHQLLAGLQRVVSRYGRLLDFTLRDLQSALQGPPLDALTMPAPLDDAPASVRGGLRTVAASRAGR